MIDKRRMWILYIENKDVVSVVEIIVRKQELFLGEDIVWKIHFHSYLCRQMMASAWTFV